MRDADRLKLVLQLDRGAEPISGQLVREDRTSSQFVGWLELTRAIEDAQHELSSSEEHREPQ